MPSFFKRSRGRLQTCDPRLVDIFERVVMDFDCTVLCGHRSKLVQDEAFRQGKSKLKWPNSKHNSKPSMAVDVAPYPIDWTDTKRFYYFAGFVMGVAAECGYKLRWGGDWDGDTQVNDQTFMDLVHFEIVE